MLRIWERPVNTKVDGKWRPADGPLQVAGDGFVKTDGKLDVAVPGSLDRPLRISDGDRWLELRLQGSSAAAKVSGASATYAGAGKGADLKLTAFGDSIKEDLVLSGADSQSSFTYDVNLSPGLKLELRKDGGADVVDGEGKVAFGIPAPIAQDAKGAIAAGDDASLSYEGGKLTVALSKAWLGEEGRAFPVLLDPTTVMGATGDTFVDEATPSTGYVGGSDLYAGREAASHDHNALLNFNVAGQVPAGAFVQQATLKLWPKFETASTGTKNLEAHEITSPWNAATWTQRNTGVNWTTPGGDFDATVLDTEPLAAFSWKTFQITDQVNKWLEGSPNYGIAITDGNSTVNRAVAFASSEWGVPADRPQLEIEYFPRSGSLENFTLDSQAISDRQTLGVNVAGGNLILESQDLNVAAKGLPVSVSRYYNSGDDQWAGQFGENGRISLGNDIVLYECDDLKSRCLIGPSGFRARFKFDAATSKYVTPSNIGNFSLTRAGATSGEFTLTDNTSGTKWNFFDNSWSFNNRITDRYGNSLNFDAGNPYGSLSKITDANARQYPITTDSDGRITKIAVPSAPFAGGVEWNYGYDPAGNLTSVTDPENKTTTYTYTGGELTKITDGRGYDTTIGYDTDGRVTSVKRQVDATAANDLTTTYAYPAVGSACDKVGSPPGTVDPKVVGQTEVTDPRSKKTTYCYDANARVVKVVNANNVPTTTEYAVKGNISKITGFAGTANVAQQFAFDNAPGGTGYKLEKVTGGAGEETNISYKGTSTTDPLQQFRVDEVTDSLGNVTGYGYDTDGNVNSVDNAAGTTVGPQNVELSWNTTVGDPKRGTLTWSEDGNNNRTTYTYDSLNRLDTISAPSILGQTKFTYDGLSRIKTVTKGYSGAGTGKTTTYNYDKLDRVVSVVDHGSITQTFGYDANGNNTTRSEPGKSSSYSYDRANRRLTESFPGASSQYTWDKSNNLKTLTDVSGTVTYDYDDINRVTQITAPAVSGTDITGYGYTDPTSSALGATTATLPGGGTIKTTRDNSGKVTEVLVKNGTAQTLKRTYGYVKSASPTVQRSQLITSTEATTGAVTTNKSYEYDTLGRLIEAKTMDASFAQTAKDTFTLDDAGNRKLRTRVTGSSTAYTSYAYNAANQLCWRSNTNVASPSCTTTPAGATSFTYDADGNQLTGDVAMTYDDKGRLATLGGASLTHLSPTNWELTAVGSTSFRNTVLGVNYINAAGNINKIQRTPETGAAVSQVRDSAKRWYVTDQIGSTIALVDSAGTVQRTYAYDIDGNDTTTGTGPATQIKFAGGHDVGSGLYHFGHRYYQPSTARWTQQDPLMQPAEFGGANRYSYVGNNPVSFVDPSGAVRIKVFGIEINITAKTVGKALLKATDIPGCAEALNKGLKVREAELSGDVFKKILAEQDIGFKDSIACVQLLI